MNERALPSSPESELAVLGAMMFSKDAIAEVATILTQSDFYNRENGVLFEAILGMWERNLPVDAVALFQSLTDAGTLEAVGGRAHIIEAYESCPNFSNALYYARIVAEKSRLRGYLSLADDLARKVYEVGVTADDVLEETEMRLMALSGADTHEPVRVGKILKPLLDRLFSGQPPNPGIPSGYPGLDRETGGWHKGELIILGSRPGIGKSSLATTFAEHAVLNTQTPTLLFSLEMTIEEIAMRLIAGQARVPLRLVRGGRLNPTFRMDIERAEVLLRDAGLFIDDTSMLRLLGIRTKVRRFKAKQNIGLVIVDYVQLVSGIRRGTMTRQEEVAEISRGLKQLARECQIPVIALAQLGRKASEDEPEMWHLRESGGLEADADVVLLLDRKLKRDPNDTDAHRKTTLLLAKQRNGRCGLSLPLIFHDEFVRFECVADVVPQTDLEQVDDLPY